MAALKSAGKKALVSYIVNGDPRPTATLKTMHGIVEAGTNMIEVGIPFSDPMAEGPVIQLGHERALEHQTSLSSTLDLVKSFREDDQQTPIVLMGYANPIERMGYEVFAKAASDSGVDGVLTVDLPPEEAEKLNAELRRYGLEPIYLLAPTTSGSRVRDIVSVAGGFIYYVSLKGVTGAGHLDPEAVGKKLNEIRKQTELPVCVGFGIKDAESAQALAKHSDGVVIGSVLVNKMGELINESDESIVKAVSSIVSGIRSGLDSEK